jgi:hypothetical protein
VLRSQRLPIATTLIARPGDGVATLKIKKQTTPAASLTESQIEKLWDKSSSFRESSSEQIIANPLSGKDPAAARAYIYWLRKHLKSGTWLKLPSESSRDRRSIVSSTRKISLGQAFGLERGKKETLLCRAHQAIVGLVRFLHDEHGYTLTGDSF